MYLTEFINSIIINLSKLSKLRLSIYHNILLYSVRTSLRLIHGKLLLKYSKE